MLFIFLKDDLEQRIVTEELEVAKIKRYGYNTDLGVEQKEQKPTFMYAVKEVVFELEDGTDCRVNTNHYTRRAVRKLVMYIVDVSGKHPIGELNNILA